MMLVREWVDYSDSRFWDCYRDFRCAERFDVEVPDSQPYGGGWAYPWQTEVEALVSCPQAFYRPDDMHIIVYVEYDDISEDGRILGMCWITFPQNGSPYLIAYIARSLDSAGEGIGGLLLERALAFVKVNAYQRGLSCETHALLDWRNAESRRLFERYGFRQPRPGMQAAGRYLEYVLSADSPLWNGGSVS